MDQARSTAFLDWLRSKPERRATERFWWLYTPVWAGACAIVMIGGFAEHWEDPALLAFGLALAVPALAVPVLVGGTTGARLTLAVALFSLLLNYTQTPFFFDVLHAHFGFHAHWKIRNNPCFLYLLTIPYFSTYCVLLLAIQRALEHAFAGRAKVLRAGFALVACVTVAGLEAVFNANPFTRHLYCFDDVPFALWFGSIAYGLAFVCILPVWRAVADGAELPLRHVVLSVCAAVYVDSLLLDVLRYHVAPHLTDVRVGADGMDRGAASCLDAP